MKKELKNLNEYDITHRFHKSPETDYRAEVVAASMIDKGYDPEKIQIERAGTARRGFSNEIEEIYEQFSTHDLTDYLYIKANKEGLYDMLPAGLFHEPMYNKKFNKDKEELLEEIQVHRQEEFFARRFFQLFEIIADETLIGASLQEVRYSRKISHPEYVRLFEPYWQILKKLNQKQAVFFMHIIPILHKIRINRFSVAEALSYILDVPVEITEIKLSAKKADRHYESRMGANRLADGLVLGNSFDDGEYDLKITIGPISSMRMLNFLETAPDSLILDELCEIFLPVDKFVVKEYKILPEDSSFILAENTFLGINTFI